MFKKALLCAACAIPGFLLSAQPTVPQLSNAGVNFIGNFIPQLVNVTEDGYLVTSTYFDYCTSITCWNVGTTLVVRDSNMKEVFSLTLQREVLQKDESNVEVQSAYIDANNDLVIAGTFLSDINFAPKDQNAVNLYGGYNYNALTRSLFLAKYRLSDGHLYWVKTMGGENYVFPNGVSLSTDAQKNIIMYVCEGDDVDIDPGPGVKKVKKGVLAKFNTNGDLLTHIPVERTMPAYKSFRVIDKKLYLLSAQDSAGTGKQNFVLQEYDTDNMKIVKSKKFGLFKVTLHYPGALRINLTMDKNGNVWLMSPYTGSCSVGSYNKTLAGTEKEQLMIKLDNNWNVSDVWPIHKTLNNATYASGFGFDSLGNMLIIGTVKDSIDVDLSAGTQWVKSTLPPPYSLQYGTLYYNCYDKNMNLLWSKTVGDTNRLLGLHVEFGHRKNVYLWGAARGTIDFDLLGTANTTTPPNDMAEIYVRYKWNTANHTTTIPETINDRLQLGVYPNPASSVLNVSIGETGSARGRLTVTDINGRLLWFSSYNGESTIQVPTATLAPGNYLLNIDIDGRTKETRKFIKQ